MLNRLKNFNHMENSENKNRVKDFFQLGELGGYFFRKKDSSKKKDFSLKAMHTINKIAIVMFLFCLIVILKRYIFGY
jgi:hypothetical protein